MYVRTGSKPVLVAINLSGQEQTVTFEGKARTLASTDASLQGVTKVHMAKLPPFSAWISSLE
jgi:hypothetical protein